MDGPNPLAHMIYWTPPKPMPSDHQAVFRGDWRTLPRHCGGLIEVMDQTIGCTECGMNLWYLPTVSHPDLASQRMDDPFEVSGVQLFPPWAPEEIKQALMNDELMSQFEYEPYMMILNMVHPFQFDDCHDPGDEDDGDWPALELYLKALAAQSMFGGEAT